MSSLSAITQANNVLMDDFHRRLTYLRLSVTEFCNFRCLYCLPKGYKVDKGGCPKHELSLPEIKMLVRGFAELGTKKVRITGGEPSIRRDLPEIIHAIAQTPGIETLCLSTNGYRLSRHVQEWIDAGLNRLNISIDSFDPATFAEMTGHDLLPQLLADIDSVLAATHQYSESHVCSDSGIDNINPSFTLKINGVLQRRFAEETCHAALDFVKTRPVTYRFIELMETSDTREVFLVDQADYNPIESRLNSVDSIARYLQAQGWSPIQRSDTAGPAVEYQHPEYRGRIGLISPYGAGFCQQCNRVRVSAQGKLHLCLFDQVNHNLRPHLQSSEVAGLKTALAQWVSLKPESHHLHEGNSGLMSNLSLVGG